MPGNFANAQDLVAIEEIKDGILKLKNGELRQVLMVSGVNFSLKSESEQNIIIQAYQSFLNSLSFPLQIVIHSRKINIENYVKSLDTRRAQEPSALLQDQIAEYQQFIRSFVEENAIMSKVFLVIVPFAPLALPTKDSLLSLLPWKKKDAAEEARAAVDKAAAFEEAKSQLSQRVTQVIDGLGSIGVQALLLQDEELVALFYNFYNPETVEKERAHA